MTADETATSIAIGVDPWSEDLNGVQPPPTYDLPLYALQFSALFSSADNVAAIFAPAPWHWGVLCSQLLTVLHAAQRRTCRQGQGQQLARNNKQDGPHPADPNPCNAQCAVLYPFRPCVPRALYTCRSAAAPQKVASALTLDDVKGLPKLTARLHEIIAYVTMLHGATSTPASCSRALRAQARPWRRKHSLQKHGHLGDYLKAMSEVVNNAINSAPPSSSLTNSTASDRAEATQTIGTANTGRR